ncbi:MAG: hydantoinase/oxoprolinase family protein, partial [Gaiellaceae bacterium]
SGPVAGAEGAAELARELGLASVITADVGGTSFDTCLITDGQPEVLYEGKVVGLPVQTSWVDVRSVGAGGGSICHIDVGNLLHIGPRSAGAYPGPASYGRGGTEPTATDAALVLGMLGPGELAAGIRLDAAAARAAFAPLREALGFDTEEEVARGAIAIVTATMANAIREITVERGIDPRESTLLAFGGAGPLFATQLARELDMTRIVVPPYAGNFSAWGLLGADLVQTAARTRILRLREEELTQANAVLAELSAELRARRDDADAGQEMRLDMRYAGQEHTLTVAVRAEGGRLVSSLEEIRDTFTREYERTFGHSMDEEIEIVSLRVALRTALPRRRLNAVAGAEAPAADRELDAYSFSRDDWLPFRIVQRGSFTELAGPAIVLEQTATTYVDAGFVVRVHDTGALIIEREGT